MDIPWLTSQSTYSRARQSRLIDDYTWIRGSSGESSDIPASVADRFSGFELVLHLIRTAPVLIPGPVVIIGEKEEIGQGSQFIVYQQSMMTSYHHRVIDSLVAVKQPKFDLHPNQRLCFMDRTSQSSLEHLCLEIKALSTPRLQRHPNIVSLISWSYDSQSYHNPITLVMELAISDLQKLLANDNETVSDQERYLLCSDIAAGLDAIHSCNLIHGDMKPGNVLIFSQPQLKRYIAKLSDFGLSVVNSEATTRIWGTRGWQAPEVEHTPALGPLNLQKADNYSFGLVVRDAMLRYKGSHSAESRKALLQVELEQVEGRIDATILSAIKPILHSLLHKDPAERPATLEPLFNVDTFGGCIQIPLEHTDSVHDKVPGRENHLTSVPLSSELPGLPDLFIDALLAGIEEAPQHGPPDTLFTVFLHLSALPRSGYHALDPLYAAASRGSTQAREVLPTASEYYKREIPSTLAPFLSDFLRSAVAMGSTLAKKHLEAFSRESLAAAICEFRGQGGYGPHYTEQSSPKQELHVVASQGEVSQLESMVNAASDLNLNAKMHEPDGPTLLYWACARGDWDVATFLLGRGADSKITCTGFRISCLHWLFAFDESRQLEIASLLLANGANLNLSVSQATPFKHYPFTLPKGTPLHWAVVTRSHTTIRVLLDLGADPLIRDGSDPYAEDIRVRVLSRFGGPRQTQFSVSGNETLGLSALDYAAMDQDPFIFETILSSPRKESININATDEEGFSVLHRLSANHIRSTRSGNIFSYRPFRGSGSQLRRDLIQTVQKIKALGGDLDLLTQPSNAQDEELGRKPGHNAVRQYTPLMLAALAGNPSLVGVLLEAGANVSAENQHGMTALHCMVDREDDLGVIKEIIELLLGAGAKVGQADKNNNTALVVAANARNLDAMELLVSHGADIGETDTNPRSVTRGRSVIAIRASIFNTSENTKSEATDIKIANLLKKYVLDHHNKERSRAVLAQGSGEGETLLWVYASRAMQHSVTALIDYGVDVNELSHQHSRRFRQGRYEHLFWDETALDVVVELRKLLVDDMRSTNRYSAKDFQSRLDKVDSVIKVITQAGGTQTKKVQRIEISNEARLKPWR